MGRLMMVLVILVTCMSTLGTTRQGLRRDARGCEGYLTASPGYSCFQRTANGGVRCSGYIAPGAPAPNWETLPVSYPAGIADHLKEPVVGKPERQMIRRATTPTNLETLRFVFLSNDNMIVFDAPNGPCFDAAGGYQVLNYAHANTFYEPGEDPRHVHAGSTW